MATYSVRIKDKIHVHNEKIYLRQSLQNNKFSLNNINEAIKNAEKNYKEKRTAENIQKKTKMRTVTSK